MSDQPRTAIDILNGFEILEFSDDAHRLFQALYDDLLARLPEKRKQDIDNHVFRFDKNGYARNFNPRVDMYNQAIDDCKAILRAYFQPEVNNDKE